MSEAIGFIGVGAMGSALAGRLVDSYSLHVYDSIARRLTSWLTRAQSSRRPRTSLASASASSFRCRVLPMCMICCSAKTAWSITWRLAPS